MSTVLVPIDTCFRILPNQTAHVGCWVAVVRLHTHCVREGSSRLLRSTSVQRELELSFPYTKPRATPPSMPVQHPPTLLTFLHQCHTNIGMRCVQSTLFVLFFGGGWCLRDSEQKSQKIGSWSALPYYRTDSCRSQLRSPTGPRGPALHYRTAWIGCCATGGGGVVDGGRQSFGHGGRGLTPLLVAQVSSRGQPP